MIKKEIKIKNKIGLRARYAALFVQIANRFLSEIFVEKDNVIVNAKSILGIMSLGVSKDSFITILVDGADEEEAIDKLFDLINNRFSLYTKGLTP